MFKKLFGGNDSQDQKKKVSYDPEKLRMLAKHFPIGRKLRYYPEYHREAMLRTIMLAYRVNDAYLYSNDGVVLDEDGSLLGFRTGGKKLLAPDAVEKMFVVVPDTSEMVRQLDYMTRAELGAGGQFRQGNTITLVAETTERCIPTLDTQVHRRIEFREGPYANSPVILLSPDLGSLTIADKRKQQRVQAELDVSLHFGRNAEMQCFAILSDFAENALRVEFRDVAPPSIDARLNSPIYIEFFLDSAEIPYRLQGKLLRHDEKHWVIRSEQIFADGEFRKLRMIDIVEIKTQLLNTANR